MEIYITKGIQQIGPFSEEEVRRQLECGDAEGGDLAWCEGSSDWMPLSEILAIVREPIQQSASIDLPTLSGTTDLLIDSPQQIPDGVVIPSLNNAPPLPSQTNEPAPLPLLGGGSPPPLPSENLGRATEGTFDHEFAGRRAELTANGTNPDHPEPSPIAAAHRQKAAKSGGNARNGVLIGLIGGATIAGVSAIFFLAAGASSQKSDPAGSETENFVQSEPIEIEPLDAPTPGRSAEALLSDPVVKESVQSPPPLVAKVEAKEEMKSTIPPIKMVQPADIKENPPAKKQDKDFPPANDENELTELVLSVLTGFRRAELNEARDCVNLLDKELSKNPKNKRIQKVKSIILDLFREEALFVAARDEYPKAVKLLADEKRNLAITYQPSSLTGRVRQDEIVKFERRVNVAQAAIQPAKTARDARRASLQKLLNASLSALPKEEREALTPVWRQVASRHGLALSVTPQTNAAPPSPSNASNPSDPPIVKIISATYGTGGKNADVTKRVKELVEGKRQKFSANPRDLGADPSPGWNKSLSIIYTTDGVRHQQRRNENETILLESFYHKK